MTRALLDVNVLIALFDQLHQDHDLAVSWLHKNITPGWASCPLTQNGFVRILTQPRYPRPLSASDAIQRLSEATATKWHTFWPDDVSLLDSTLFHRSRIHGPHQLTDLYLLSLATQHHGRLVTFDRSIPLNAVSGATQDHLVVL